MEVPKVKKIYTRPQIFVVTLDHEQAILSACSLMATSARAGADRTAVFKTAARKLSLSETAAPERHS